MKKINLGVILLFFCPPLFGSVVIEGKIVNLKTKQSLYYHEPLDGFPNMYYESKKIDFLTDSTFRIVFPLKKQGFVHLGLPGQLFKLFVQPGQRMFIRLEYRAELQLKEMVVADVTVSGDNGPANELLCLRRLSPGIRHLLYNRSFQSPSRTVKELFDKSMNDLTDLLHPFDDLLSGKQIDSNFHFAVSGDIRSEFGWQLIDAFGFLRKQKGTPPANKPYFKAVTTNRLLFTEQGYDSLRRLVYQHFKPFDTANLYSVIGGGLTVEYCTDIYRGFIRDTISFDSAFLGLKTELRYLGYLKGRFLEKAWSGELYYQTMVEPDVAALQRNFDMFRSLFPASKFIPALRTRVEKAVADSKYSVEDIEIVDLSSKKYSTLKELARTSFKNRYVFIDLWATWCSPCIQEFSYKNELQHFLQTKGIAMLYISIDDASQQSRWTKIIKDREIHGYHILAGPALLEDINKRVYKNKNGSIPRYLLLDPQGNVLAAELPRPSNMPSLQKTIDKLVK